MHPFFRVTLASQTAIASLIWANALAVILNREKGQVRWVYTIVAIPKVRHGVQGSVVEDRQFAHPDTVEHRKFGLPFSRVLATKRYGQELAKVH